RAELRVLKELPTPTRKLVTGSISILKVLRLILVSRSLEPTVNTEEEAKLLPSTSLVAVKLRPNCSTSLRLPPEIINLLFLSTKNLADIPYLNLSSPKP